MKIKNLTARNVGLMAGHNKERGIPFRVNVVANSTLELDDADYAKVKSVAKGLVEKGILKIVSAPATQLTKKELIAKVLKEVDVELKESLSLPKLQEKAEALGVEV